MVLGAKLINQLDEFGVCHESIFDIFDPGSNQRVLLAM